MRPPRPAERLDREALITGIKQKSVDVRRDPQRFFNRLFIQNMNDLDKRDAR